MLRLANYFMRFVAVLLCLATASSWGAEYQIVRRAKSMDVEMAFTDQAATYADGRGGSLQSAIDQTSPMLFMALLQVAKGGKVFDQFVISRVYGNNENAIDVVAVRSKGQVIEVSDSQNPVIQSLFANLKTVKLLAGGSAGLDVSPSDNKAVKVALKK